MLGQLSLLALLAYVAGLALLSRGRELEAGLVLAVVAVKPQLLVVMPLLLLIKGRGKALVGMAVGVSGLLGLSVLLVGPFDVAEFLGVNLETAGWLPPTLNLTLFGFMSGLFQPWPALILPATLIAEALILYLLWWGWRGEWRPGDTPFRLKLALLLLASMAAAPHLYAHDLVLLVPVAFYVVDYLISTQGSGRGLGWAKLLAVVVFVAALVDSYPVLGLPIRPMFLAIMAVGGAILLAARDEARGRRPTEVPGETG